MQLKLLSLPPILSGSVNKIPVVLLAKSVVDLANRGFCFSLIKTGVYWAGVMSNNPYNFNKKQIMICYKLSEEAKLDVLKHELNHFMFLYYFASLEEKVSKYEFAALKESLTVFTNPEEKGYPAHQKLRKYLKTEQANIPEIVKKGEWIKYL